MSNYQSAMCNRGVGYGVGLEVKIDFVGGTRAQGPGDRNLEVFSFLTQLRSMTISYPQPSPHTSPA